MAVQRVPSSHTLGGEAEQGRCRHGRGEESSGGRKGCVSPFAAALRLVAASVSSCKRTAGVQRGSGWCERARPASRPLRSRRRVDPALSLSPFTCCASSAILAPAATLQLSCPPASQDRSAPALPRLDLPRPTSLRVDSLSRTSLPRQETAQDARQDQQCQLCASVSPQKVHPAPLTSSPPHRTQPMDGESSVSLGRPPCALLTLQHSLVQLMVESTTSRSSRASPSPSLSSQRRRRGLVKSAHGSPRAHS